MCTRIITKEGGNWLSGETLSINEYYTSEGDVNEKLKSKISYENLRPVKHEYWYENGNKKSENNYQWYEATMPDDSPGYFVHGKQYYYHENGILASECLYENSRLKEEQKWDINGVEIAN